MKNKAELTTQQIVMLIILIVSFVIILFLVFRLNLGETSQKEICHNSVILKERSLVGVTLDCKTNYICISGGEDCENFNPSETIKIDLNNPDAEKLIMKTIADEMADCWWMFGEGKVDYVGDYSGYHCAICSIIHFDKEIQDKVSKTITYDDFYSYLENTKKDDSQTYLKYLYGSPSFSTIKPYLGVNQFSFSDAILFEEKYAVLTGRNKEALTSDAIVYPSFIKSGELTDKTECTDFDLTKS